MDTKEIINLAIVDDHQLIVAGLTSLITTQMPEVNVLFTAANGKELFEKIEHAEVKPDICIIDIFMPVMDGFETMIRLKNKYPHIKGFALTQNATDLAILTMLNNGARGYMLKDIQPNEFRNAISLVFGNEFYYSPEVLKKFPKINPSNMARFFSKLLSPRLTKFLSLCCSNMTYDEIAATMHISKKTAEHYSEKISKKLGLNKRIELALYSLKSGIGSFDK